jgi:lipopolysaccharide export system permease protein
MELAERRADPDEMGFFELRKFIKRIVRAGGDPIRERTDLYMKLSYPFINFIILLFGVPLALRFQRSGLAMGFAQSLTIAFVYFGAIRIGQVLAYNGTLPPLLGATIANIFFGTAGIILLFSYRQ